jgi:hypothetical protein
VAPPHFLSANNILVLSLDLVSMVNIESHLPCNAGRHRLHCHLPQKSLSMRPRLSRCALSNSGGMKRQALNSFMLSFLDRLHRFSTFCRIYINIIDLLLAIGMTCIQFHPPCNIAPFFLPLHFACDHCSTPVTYWSVLRAAIHLFKSWFVD